MLDLLTAYHREQMSINNLVMTWNEFTQREKAAMLPTQMEELVILHNSIYKCLLSEWMVAVH